MTSFLEEVVEKIDQVPKVADTMMSGSAVRSFFKKRAALYTVFVDKYTGLQDAKGLIISPEDVTMNRMALLTKGGARHLILSIRRRSLQKHHSERSTRGFHQSITILCGRRGYNTPITSCSVQNQCTLQHD